jgi:hypothetical protein
MNLSNHTNFHHQFVEPHELPPSICRTTRTSTINLSNHTNFHHQFVEPHERPPSICRTTRTSTINFSNHTNVHHQFVEPHERPPSICRTTRTSTINWLILTNHRQKLIYSNELPPKLIDSHELPSSISLFTRIAIINKKKSLKIPKGVIRIRISKKDKRTNNNLRSIHIKLKTE